MATWDLGVGTWEFAYAALARRMHPPRRANPESSRPRPRSAGCLGCTGSAPPSCRPSGAASSFDIRFESFDFLLDIREAASHRHDISTHREPDERVRGDQERRGRQPFVRRELRQRYEFVLRLGGRPLCGLLCDRGGRRKSEDDQDRSKEASYSHQSSKAR
jgi:hypothetical protein